MAEQENKNLPQELNDEPEIIVPGTHSPKHLARRVESRFEGPLPHPDIFRQYGEIIPNAPERILQVFEQDSAHIRTIEMSALNAQVGDNKRIHWMAYTLVMAGFVLAAFFAWIEKDGLAYVILGTTISAILYSFLKSNREAKKSSDT